MKRLLGLGLLLVIVIAAVSSHGKGNTSTSTAAESEPPPTTSVASAASPPKAQAARVVYTRCDQNISAGPHTTCGFADNVFRSFASKDRERSSGIRDCHRDQPCNRQNLLNVVPH